MEHQRKKLIILKRPEEDNNTNTADSVRRWIPNQDLNVNTNIKVWNYIPRPSPQLQCCNRRDFNN